MQCFYLPIVCIISLFSLLTHSFPMFRFDTPPLLKKKLIFSRGDQQRTLGRNGLTCFSPMLHFIWKSVICFAEQNMTGFYMKRNTGLKWVKLTLVNILYKIAGSGNLLCFRPRNILDHIQKKKAIKILKMTSCKTYFSKMISKDIFSCLSKILLEVVCYNYFEK